MSTHKSKTEQQEAAQPSPDAGAPPGGGPRTPLSEDAADDPRVRWRTKDPAAAADGEAGFAEDGNGEAGRQAEQDRADEYFAKWQRTAADMANMRRRHEQERQEYTRQANATLMADLLPVLDSFDRALESVPRELHEQTWIDGILRVERQLRTVLERAGLQPIEAAGKPFDPTEHEALMHEASDQPEDTVTGELQRGYKLYDRILRPAMVKVAKNG